MSFPIISVTSALPLTLSPSIRPFNILLATLSVCFSHPWLNSSPNTAIALEEGLPSWNLLTYQNGHLNGLRAKINAIRPLQESLLRSLGKTWPQLFTHRSAWAVQPLSVQAPFILPAETLVCITKEAEVFLLFFCVALFILMVSLRTQFMINLARL